MTRPGRTSDQGVIEFSGRRVPDCRRWRCSTGMPGQRTPERCAAWKAAGSTGGHHRRRDACRKEYALLDCRPLPRWWRDRSLTTWARVGALRLIRRGAEVILLHGDVKRYVQVRMAEALILWETGERDGAAEVWRTMAREAALRGDALFMAVLQNAIAVFQLRLGGAEAAAGLFEIAHDTFDHEGLTGEAIQARRGMAEAAVARGRINEGISEYYKVKALALAAGNLRQAALAAAEIVGLVLLTGRNREIDPLADSMVSLFSNAGQEHAMHTWVQVRQFAMHGRLTPSDVQGLRSYFQRFVL